MKKALISALLVAACSSSTTGQPRANSAPEAAESSQSVESRDPSPWLTNFEIEVLTVFEARPGGREEYETAKKRALAKLGKVAPGWWSQYEELTSDKEGACLKWFSAQQRASAESRKSGKPIAANEVKRIGQGLGSCQADGEKAVADHLAVLRDKHSDRLDLELLHHLLSRMYDGDFNLTPLSEKFPSEARVWAWQGRLDIRAASRLQGAHRCLSLDAGYPGCSESYGAAVEDYEQWGCTQDKAKAALQLAIGTQSIQDGFLSVVETSHSQTVAGLSGEIVGIWQDRTAFPRTDVVSIELTDAGKKTLMEIPTTPNAFLVWRVGKDGLETFQFGHRHGQLLTSEGDRGSSAAAQGLILKLCKAVEKREVPNDLRWRVADEKDTP